MSNKQEKTTKRKKLPIVFHIIDENLEVSKNTILNISNDLPSDFIEKVAQDVELSLQKINNNPRLFKSDDATSKIDYDKIKNIANIRRQCFEHRLKWYTKYKNNNKKSLKNEAEYEKLLEEQLDADDVQKQMKLSQKIRKLEERKLKLEDEKLKLEDMQKDESFEIQELNALRKILS